MFPFSSSIFHWMPVRFATDFRIVSLVFKITSWTSLNVINRYLQTKSHLLISASSEPSSKETVCFSVCLIILRFLKILNTFPVL